MNSSFTEKITAFWAWFEQNEKRLSDMLKDFKPDQSEQILAAFLEGTELISKNIYFNVGGDHEFTFAVSGDTYLFYLLPHIVLNLPEKYRGKWHFFSCMPGKKGHNFDFTIHEVKLAAQDVQVSLSIAEGTNAGDIGFYHKNLASLPEKEQNNTFYILMENIIGEALAFSCINNIKFTKPGLFKPKMFPLTQLEEKLTAAFCKDGGIPDPAQSVFTYQMQPKDSNVLRDDIFVGFGYYAELTNEYYAQNNESFARFTEFGAIPVFLHYEYDTELNGKKNLDERNEIMDRLEAEILGKYSSSKKQGLIFGGAMGEKKAYIDMLLYDYAWFAGKAIQVLQDYSHQFYLSEFVQNGNTIHLT